VPARAAVAVESKGRANQASTILKHGFNELDGH
jgi:hypothetical protein